MASFINVFNRKELSILRVFRQYRDFYAVVALEAIEKTIERTTLFMAYWVVSFYWNIILI
jgi:hypothetical protein